MEGLLTKRPRTGHLAAPIYGRSMAGRPCPNGAARQDEADDSAVAGRSSAASATRRAAGVAAAPPASMLASTERLTDILAASCRWVNPAAACGTP